MNTLAKESVENSRASQLRLAFDSAFALPPSVASPPGEDLLTIRVAGDPYAIRLTDIAEILTERRIVAVPSVTPDLLGLAGIHGGIVPVFGLSSILGYAPDPGSPRWMVLCSSEEPFALAFSDFEGYLRLPTSALHADENFRTTHEQVKYVNQIDQPQKNSIQSIDLTPREAEVRTHLLEGRSNKEIASLLNISPRTVEVHKSRVLEKLGQSSVISMIRSTLLNG